jgi:hypothetical protein
MTTMKIHRPTLLLGLLALGTTLTAGALLTGCGAVSARPRTAVRDSAGVTIVDNYGHLQPDGSGWRVAPEPVLSIGTLEGEWTDQLFGVREAMRLPDGRIAIANAGTEEIRIYGPDGSFLNVFGGDGEGPGEFQGLSLVGILPGDTLVAVGRRSQRITLVHPEEGFIRTVTPEGLPDGPLEGYGLLADGRMVTRAGLPFSIEALEEGWMRLPMSYYSAHFDGSELVEYPQVPGPETMVDIGEQYVSIMQLPFGKRPAIGVTGELTYFGSGDSYEIRAYDGAGELNRIIRLDQELLPFTDDDIDRYIEEQVAEAADLDEAREIRSSFNDFTWPETLAAFLSFEADPLGCLWVEEARVPGDEVPIWTVFDAQGALQARVSLPEGVELLEVGEDYILGLVRDELDVEYVQTFRLERYDD